MPDRVDGSLKVSGEGQDFQFSAAQVIAALSGSGGAAGLAAEIAARIAGDQQAVGGVLAGNLPNPSFAVDMATQAELDAVSAIATNHRGTLAARPSSLTLFDAGYWYLAEDEDGGTPYLWTGVAWERAGKPVGGDTLRVTQSPYNCKADGVKLADGAITLASPTILTSATAVFAASDVGKVIAVEAAGAGGGTQLARAVNGQATLTQMWLQVQIKNATGGTWSYTHTGLGTAAGIAYNAPAATVQTALEALYGAGKVIVSLSGTTYTITLQTGAADTDTTKVTAASSLTGTANGANPTASVFNQSWTYGDVGKRVHVPGAGAAGGVLVAWIGSIEVTNSNIAYLVDASGVALNASATGAFTYHTLNWLRTTIAAVNSPTSVTLTAGLDAGVQADLTGLEVWYGTDNLAGLTAALTAASVGIPLDMGAGTFLTSAGVASTVAGGDYRLYGQGAQWRSLALDSEAESGRFAVGGNADTTAGRAKRVDMNGWSWGVPTAHYRGFGTTILTLPLGSTTKTNPGGIAVTRANRVSLHRMTVDTNYGLAFGFTSCRYGFVSHCEAWNSWADSFNFNNNNSSYTAPAYGDFTFIGCAAYNSGDDCFTINHRAGNSPRPQNVSWIGCRGYQTRQFALGRGFNMLGGTNITVADCECYGINGNGLDIIAGLPDNVSKSATVTTPGTGAQIDFPSAPPNVTAGTTQVQVFSGTGASWIGDVTAITNAGLTLTLTARADQVATCPFTGASLYAQWGGNTSGTRFGSGGGSRFNVTNFTSDTTALNTSADGLANAAVRVQGGNCSSLAVSDVLISGLNIYNAYQIGILTTSTVLNTTGGTLSDVTAFGSLVRDVTIENVLLAGTGFSTLTGFKPWPGFYVQYGQNITLRNAKFRDTYDGAVLIHSTGSHLSGRIMVVDVEGSDIGRGYSNATPLPAAFDPGTATTYSAHFERVFLTNPSGTSGGTKYVSTVVLGSVPTGSTVRGVNSDITGQALIDESAARYSIVVSPIMFRGKGTPEGVVTASPGAIYERSDGSAGTALYVKESGTGNTGWVAYASPGGQPAPALDLVHSHDPLTHLAATGATAAVANQIYFVRLRGIGSISNLLFWMSATAGQFGNGNVIVAVYATNGSTGRNAKPSGSPLFTSASTATTSGGMTVSLGGTQAVTHLNFWAALIFSNALDRVLSTTGGIGALTNGFMWVQSPGAFTMEAAGAHAISTGTVAPIVEGG